MQYKTIEPLKAIKNCLIFSHGLGDTNEGFYYLFTQLKTIHPQLFQNTLMLFPLAPVQPVTWNMGSKMTSWFDIKNMPSNLTALTTKEGEENAYFSDADFKKSLQNFTELIKTVSDKYQLSTEKFVIGGFSQGAALALGLLWYAPFKLGGIVALSGFPVIMDHVAGLKEEGKNLDTPVFQGHGMDDPMVPYSIGEYVAKYHTQLLTKTLDPKMITFKGYKGLQHSTNEQELDDMVEFLQKLLN